MSTVINNPANGEDSSGVAGMLIGIIVLVIAFILFFLYGLPMLRTNPATQEAPKSNSLDVNVTLPKTDQPKTDQPAQ